MSELSSTVGGWVWEFRGQMPKAVFPARGARSCLGTDAFALDAFQTDRSSVDHLCARSKSHRPTSDCSLIRLAVETIPIL